MIYVETDTENWTVWDADYTDLYLVIIKQVSDDLAQLGLSFDKKLLAAFESWFKEITHETEESGRKVGQPSDSG